MTIQACLYILELDSAKDHDQLHRAYRRQVKRWHPDQFAHQPAIHAEAEERLKRINHAYSALKEHLKKKSTSSHISTPHDPNKDRRRQDAPPKRETPFQWSRWFKPKDRKSDQNKDKTKRTCGPQEHRKTSFSCKKPKFERILREAADNPRRHFGKTFSGARPILHPHLSKQCKKGMRIEGFRSAKPITPIRPISKINKIEGSG